MKKFILRVSNFILPLLVLGYCFDVFISHNLKKAKNNEFPIWNDIFLGKLNASLLIYGSSRALVHFDPDILTKELNTPAYNVGINGHNFWLQYLRHKLILKYNPKPQIILFSLDTHTLEKRPDLYVSSQFLPYMLGNKAIEKATHSYEGFNSYDYHIPVVRYYGKADDIILAARVFIRPESLAIDRIKGYHGQDMEWNDDFENARKNLNEYVSKTDPDTLKLFDHFLAECKKENIQVILIYSPEYIEGQKFQANRNEMIGIFKEFSKKYQLPFFDYSNDAISFNKDYFYNTQHMNRRGAELFSLKISKMVKPYLHENI